MLSHVRLGLLLSLLSSSMLLDTRLSVRTGGHNEFSRAQVPLGSLYFALSLCAILAGVSDWRGEAVYTLIWARFQAGGHIGEHWKISSDAKHLLASRMRAFTPSRPGC